MRPPRSARNVAEVSLRTLVPLPLRAAFIANSLRFLPRVFSNGFISPAEIAGETILSAVAVVPLLMCGVQVVETLLGASIPFAVSAQVGNNIASREY